MAHRGVDERKPYYHVTRLFSVAASNWTHFHGWCLENGIKLRKLNSDEFLDLVYYWATRNMSSKEAGKFDFDLWLPPKGVEPEDDHPYFGQEAEMREFEKSMGNTSLSVRK